jgi:hypothetical protein
MLEKLGNVIWFVFKESIGVVKTAFAIAGLWYACNDNAVFAGVVRIIVIILLFYMFMKVFGLYLKRKRYELQRKKNNGVIVHELKVYPCYFEEIRLGNKTFELRRFERDYQVGDILRLREHEKPPKYKEWLDDDLYTGRELTAVISYVLPGGEFPGVDDDYCVLGFKGVHDLDLNAGNLIVTAFNRVSILNKVEQRQDLSKPEYNDLVNFLEDDFYCDGEWRM